MPRTIPHDVTVVIPTRNRRPLLAQALRSVLHQQGEVDLQVVVVDEASSDDTPEFLARLHDDRVTVVRHDNPRGPAGARNTGIALADTTWVAFLDDDDLWAPSKLARQLDALESTGAAWATAGTVYTTPELDILGAMPRCTCEPLYPAMLVRLTISGGSSAVVAHRDLLAEAGPFAEELHGVEDWDMWVRLGALDATPACVDHPEVGYRIFPTSLSHDTERLERVFRAFADRHAAARAAHGVEIDEIAVARYLAQRDLSAGRRAKAARRLAGASLREGSVRGLARAALTAVAPALAERYESHHLQNVLPESWRAEADAWLATYRPAGPVETGTVGTPGVAAAA